MTTSETLIKLIKLVMFADDTNLLQATAKVMDMVSESSTQIREEYKTTGRVKL